jgi:hypothetical protein
MQLRASLVALCLLPSLAFGCAVSSPEPSDGVGLDGEDDQAEVDDLETENGRGCTIRANLLGLAAAGATVAVSCTAAAVATGGVTLICSAPAGVIAGVAAGASVAVSLATQRSCGGRSVPANTTGTFRATAASNNGCSSSRRSQLQSAINQHCKKGRSGREQASLECKNNRGYCEVRGDAARQNASSARLCAENRDAMNKECFNGGDSGHRNAADWARRIASDCSHCARQGGGASR